MLLKKNLHRRRIISIALFTIAIIAIVIPYLHLIGAIASDFIISDNIRNTEQTARYVGWTDSVTADYEEHVGLQKEMKESDNDIVRFVATNTSSVVVIPFLLGGTLLGLLIYLLVLLLKEEYRYLKSRR